MADVDISKLMLAATSIFISGIIVFSVAFYGYSTYNQMLETIGLESNPEIEATLQIFKILPTAITVIYIIIVFVVIYYLIYRGSKGSGKAYPEYPELEGIFESSQGTGSFGEYGPPPQG
ncbi:MAG: hypothetical protein PHW96_01675 [Candidatus Nanoarchaeia archaeon]|nr:hypothetical protein [Candidatus Nanoarchaeia archaeon]